ncbi:hypothetical protein SAMN00790413_06387 [Deinococcus hopiensis KR-140]|uniref:Uncharacterized protein n=1 Tax=Deinococcus hopiensis KR-140 TaxID=695939 RepID=A0A1W1VWC0_9DEIO|nr:hypothetical protein SAMN00790413_06387 [Deinococcus hopiensis KR-140]
MNAVALQALLATPFMRRVRAGRAVLVTGVMTFSWGERRKVTGGQPIRSTDRPFDPLCCAALHVRSGESVMR